MNSYILTDNQLAQLFLEFKTDFEKMQREGKDVTDITQQLGEKLFWSLQHGHLKDLYPAEKHKTYQVLDTVIQSMPAYRELPKTKQKIEIPTTIKKVHHYHHYPHNYYCNQPDPWLTWLILSNRSRPVVINNYNGGTYTDSHHHGRQEENKKEDPFAQLILFLLLGALVLSAFILAFFALRELIDCGDRIFHNEGTMRALLSLSIMAASGLVGAFLGSVVFAGSLSALAIAAGTSPVGVIVIASIALAMIGSGTVGLLFSHFKVQELFIRKNNKDAMDPAEPQRFSLTEEQEQNLRDMGLDITKVKCAMVAIRNQMDSKHVQDKLWRLFTSQGETHQQLLEQLRDLKDGKYTQAITVGNMHFDLRAPELTSSYYYQEPTSGLDFQPQTYTVQPSAPMMEEYEYPSSYNDGFGVGTTTGQDSNYPLMYEWMKSKHSPSQTQTEPTPSRYPDLSSYQY